MIRSNFVIVLLLFLLPAELISNKPLSNTNIEISEEIGSFTNVNAKEFKKLIDTKKYVLVDFRTAKEFNSGHIKEAVLIDWYRSDFKLEIQKLDKSKQVLIYCRSGNRTGRSKQLMLSLGFKSVINLEKGIIDWSQNGYGFVK